MIAMTPRPSLRLASREQREARPAFRELKQ